MTTTTREPQHPAPAATSLLVACDIDGTLVRTGHPVTDMVRDAASRVRAAGHHIVLATGRSLVGALPIAVQLGLDDAWIVASNGAVTAHLVGDKYQVTEQHNVDAETAVRLAVREAPGIRIAAEVVGAGYRVNLKFPAGELNGEQREGHSAQDLWELPTPRMALYGPGAYRLVPALLAHGLTAIATRLDWVDVTTWGISKATALEKVRATLGVEAHNTAAIGDGENDLEMLSWAATASPWPTRPRSSSRPRTTSPAPSTTTARQAPCCRCWADWHAAVAELLGGSTLTEGWFPARSEGIAPGVPRRHP